MYKLIIQDDEGKTTVVNVVRDEITIGRKEGNSIRLTERNVSRRHARLLRENGAVLIEDLESYNGIRVNGTRIQGRVSVTEADRIQIGDYLLELKMDHGPQPQDPFSDQRTQPMDRAADPQSPGGGPPPPGVPPGGGQNGHSASHQDPTAIVHVNNVQGRPKTLELAAQPHPEPAPSAHPTAMMQPISAAQVAAGTRPDAPARLVVVSTNFAGREFLLDKPAMVVGRTDDNDIVVNHRSISRHHAKIVHENGRYNIVDLQSANGVRVNGEEYGKVELRRGDMVDLGHVRLRFADPDDTYVFSRDQVQHVAAPRQGSNKGIIIAIAAVITLLTVVVIVLVAGRGGGKKDKSGVSAANSNGTSEETTPGKKEGTSDPIESTKPASDATQAGSEVPPNELKDPVEQKDPETPTQKDPTETAGVKENPPTDASAEVAKYVTEAQAAMGEERWSDALALARLAEKADPTNAEAKDIAARADSEMKAEALWKEFEDAVRRSAVEDAVRLRSKIPEGSTYRDRATAQLQDLKKAYVDAREQEAKNYLKNKKCKNIKAIGAKVDSLFGREARSGIDRIQQQCKEAEEVAVKKDTPPKEDKPPKNDPPKEKPDADALVKEAKSAYNSGRYAEALSLAEKAARAGAGESAERFAAAAACKLKDKGKATSYLKRLSTQNRNFIKQICASAGIPIEEQ